MGYLSDLLSSLQTSLSWLHGFWAYAVLFLLVLVEGPIAILIAAGLTASGVLNVRDVFITATAGNLVADLLWYALGYYAPPGFLLKISRFFKINAQKVALLTGLVNQHAVKLLLFAKVTNGLIVPLLIATGISRVSMRRWFPVIFVSNFFISGIFLAAGYYLTFSLLQVQKGLRYLAIFATVVILLAAGFYLKHKLSHLELVETLQPGEEKE